MNYNEMMQKPGKQIHPKLYYYDETGIKVEVERDNIEKAKISFNAPLTGSVMLGLLATLKIKLPDKPIYFQNNVTYNGTNATKIYGPFYLKEEPKFNADSKTYEHTMYDGLLKTMVDYKPISIIYPTTVLDFFKQLCLECGYTTDITNLPNGSRTINADIYDGINYTYRDVLDDIANATGSLFRLKNNEIQKCNLGVQNSVIVDDDLLKNQNIQLGEHFGPINSVVLSRSAESDNIYKRDETLTTWNEYKIVDNQLMNDNNRSDYLDELYGALYGIEYDIFDLELVGYGGFEPLEKVNINTNNATYISYVFNNELTFTQGVEESIYTEMPEESTTDYKMASTTDKKINQAYIIVDKQNKKIDQVVNEVDQYNNRITNVEQSIDGISQEVSQISNLIREKQETGFLQLENANGTELKSLSIKGDISLLFGNDGNTFGDNVPFANILYPSSNLFGKNMNLIIEYDDENKEVIHLPFSYLNYINQDVCDEFVIEQGNAKIIRRVGVNSSMQKYSLDSEFVEDLGTFVIMLQGGNPKLYLQCFNNAIYKASYMIRNEYTDEFATKLELNTSIKQTSDSINMEVAKKVDENEIISSINQTAEKIKIKANKLELEGYTTINDGFSIDENGNMIAKNGKFTGGDITLYDDSEDAKNAKLTVQNSNNDRWLSFSPLEIAFGRSEYQGSDSNERFQVFVPDSFSSIMLRNRDLSSKIECIAFDDSSGLNIRLISNNQLCAQIMGTDTYIENLRYRTISGSSLASKKKNFELLDDNAMAIILNSDIYKFNFKNEDDNSKKHIGIVIGDNFKYSKEITDNKESGVDLYSMISVAWKAIQEQNAEIKKLKSEINKLKESEI